LNFAGRLWIEEAPVLKAGARVEEEELVLEAGARVKEEGSVLKAVVDCTGSTGRTGQLRA
jgi:hypothetical protein